MAIVLCAHQREGALMKMVTVGGGTGQYHVLRACMILKSRVPNMEITAIPTTSDSGGSSGRIRVSCNIIAPGDISQCIMGLHSEPDRVGWLLGHRLNGGSLEGHSVRNLIVTAALQQFGQTQHALDKITSAFELEGRITPATFTATHLRATLGDGSVLASEDAIYRADIVARGGIRTLSLVPQPEPNTEALSAISTADLIIVCPGTLVCSIVPNFLVPEMREALVRAPARKVYVANLTNRRGHVPNGWTVSDHADFLEHFLLRGFFDRIVANAQPLTEPQHALYRESSTVPAVRNGRPDDTRIIEAELLGEVTETVPQSSDDLLQYRATVRHDPLRLADALQCLL